MIWLAAILRTRLVAASNQTLNSDSKPFILRDDLTPMVGPKRMRNLKIQELIRQESVAGLPVECCPSVEEMIQPLGGINQQGLYTQLYREDNNQQRFMEYSCRPDVVDKPCRFLNRKIRAQSRCRQQFTYVYAIVLKPESKDGNQTASLQEMDINNNDTTLALDFIRVRKGCSCEINPKPKKRKIAVT